MTAPNLTHVLSPEEFDQAQALTGPALQNAPFAGTPAAKQKKAPDTNLGRVLSPEEFDHAQTLAGPAVKALRLPLLPPVVAPRDVTRTPMDRNTKGAPIETPVVGAVLRQAVNPVLENPFTTAAVLGASGLPVVGPIVAGVMGGTMALDIARYGYQNHLESTATPGARKEMLADPERVSGEAAAVQAAMLGLAPLIHVGVKAYRGTPVEPGTSVLAGRSPAGRPSTPIAPMGDVSAMELPVGTNKFISDLEAGAATARIPHDVQHPAGFEASVAATAPATRPRHPSGFSVDNPFAPENVGKVKPLATETPADVLDATAAKANDPMRPRRRAQGEKNFFESPQGAETLGTMAGRHGLPEDASPYPPATPLDDAWKNGHAAATESFPEGFTMGGSLAESRIPPDYTAPRLAGVEPNAIPEGATPETAALADALRPSRYRGHSTDDLAAAALDAQSALEAANKDVAESATREHTAWNDPEATPESVLWEDRGIHATDVPSLAAEKAAARAKAQLAQIEREFALRGVAGQDLADVIAAAKETRLERQGVQEEATLGVHTGTEPDPFGGEPAPVTEPVGAGAGSAQPPVEGTGATKTRGLAAGVEAKAVANRLTTSLGDLPQYQAVSMAEQSAAAVDLLTRDPELARRVALGEVPPPHGLLPESVFVAVENRAIEEGDVATIRDLATGRLTSEATTMGQRIRALGERDPDSPVAAIKDVVKARTGGAKNVPRATEEVVADIRAKLQQARLAPEVMAKFIDSLRC